jgi:fatty-acyl-CoA synthase
VIEFYGATEGNVALLNLDGKPGAVGRLPGWLRRIAGVEVVRWDAAREEPVRNAEGFCLRCEAGEPGELIGRISAVSRFEGYSNAAATEKKILRDVFERGDAYFRTGDLLRFDSAGYFYFVDRIGDTFRWKGENVATTEVAEVMSRVPGVREVNVYGVSVPGYEGRAGMAALVASDELDLAALREHIHAALPSYARPLFLRRVPSLDVTGTLKLRKVELVAEGFDPARVRDPLYLDDAASAAYVPLDAGRFAQIASGAVRL